MTRTAGFGLLSAGHIEGACSLARFIHSADLHLGRRFGQFDRQIAGRLEEARHGAIGRLADAARSFGAPLVILAGDVFDSAAPSPQVLRQALDAFAGHDDLAWALMPGNHDIHVDGGVWDRVAADAPANAVLLLAPEPVAFGADLTLLPTPWTGPATGRDETEWMDRAATGDGRVRLGIAHGPALSFGEETAGAIDPGRAERAQLDYLALGDWHGALTLSPRCRYSGTPEPDRFRPDSGLCLGVAIEAPGAPPEVTEIDTAAFRWLMEEAELRDGDAPDLTARLPEGAERRDLLLRLTLTGACGLETREAWRRAAADLAPSLLHMETDADAVRLRVPAGDLDRIDQAGALRDAADALLARSEDPRRAEAERDEARLALSMLYSWCVEMDDAS